MGKRKEVELKKAGGADVQRDEGGKGQEKKGDGAHTRGSASA